MQSAKQTREIAENMRKARPLYIPDEVKETILNAAELGQLSCRFDDLTYECRIGLHNLGYIINGDNPNYYEVIW